MKMKQLMPILIILLIANLFLVQAAQQNAAIATNNPISSYMQKEIQIAPEFQLLYSILTAFSGTNTTSLSKIIFLTIFFILIFIFSRSILEFTPFEEEWVKILIATSLSVILTVLGWVNSLTALVFNAKETINIWLYSWKFYASILGILILLLCLKIVKRFYKKIETKSKEEESLGKAKLAGTAIDNLSKMSKDISNESNKK